MPGISRSETAWTGRAQAGTTSRCDSVNARPCAEPHDMEVYGILEYLSVSGVSYPGDDVLTEWGFDKCFAGFQSYIGAP